MSYSPPKEPLFKTLVILLLSCSTRHSISCESEQVIARTRRSGPPLSLPLRQLLRLRVSLENAKADLRVRHVSTKISLVRAQRRYGWIVRKYLFDGTSKTLGASKILDVGFPTSKVNHWLWLVNGSPQKRHRRTAWRPFASQWLSI